MALLKTAANSTPTMATPKAKSVNRIVVASAPGTAIHSEAVPATVKTVNKATHGLRGPTASAIAPSTGDMTAIRMPVTASIVPHSVCASAPSPTTPVAK